MLVLCEVGVGDWDGFCASGVVVVVVGGATTEGNSVDGFFAGGVDVEVSGLTVSAAGGGGPTRVMNLRSWAIVDDGVRRGEGVSETAVRISISCSVYFLAAMEMRSFDLIDTKLSASSVSCPSVAMPSPSRR